MRLFLFAAVALALGTQANAQVRPAEVPPGPPPQPGQLGPPPQKLPQKATEPPPQSTEPVPTEHAGSGPISVTTQYVLVPTSVFDPDGHGYVNGLAQNDFEVYDNGKPQKISAEYTEQPLSVVLVVQANSEVEPLLPELKRSGVLFHGLVTGVQGDIAVLAFDHRLQVLQDFTDNPDRLDDAMQKIRAGSSSARLIDAVREADHMLKLHDPRDVRRRVIVLLSRNIDKGSEGHLQETVRSMQFDNVIIYCVNMSRVKTAFMSEPGYPRPQNGGVPPEALPNIAGGQGTPNQTTVIQQENGNALNGVPPIARAIHDLFKRSPAEAFSYFTAGRIYTFGNERGLETAVSDIGADLNSQYLLSYSPNDKSDPGFHVIKVVVNRPGLKIRSRPGYWWGGGATQ